MKTQTKWIRGVAAIAISALLALPSIAQTAVDPSNTPGYDQQKVNSINPMPFTGQSLTTDLNYYQPGATVTIKGTGFHSGEPVSLQAIHANGSYDNHTEPAHQPWTVIADANGSFVVTWLEPSNSFETGARYRLNATGQQSGFTSTALFSNTTPTNSSFIEPDASFGTFAANDDGTIGPFPLSFTFDMYCSLYNQVYINNNGNLTFDQPYFPYTASGFPFNVPMVAPFWADVDTRGAGSGLVRYQINPTNVIVVYENVGYYGAHTDKLNSFEVIITNGNDPIIGVGNNVAFRYKDMQWTTGDASSGSGGFGGVPATVGINKGNSVDFVQIGRFGLNSAVYDGGGGATDGINYLDDQNFTFDVSGCTNLAPSVNGAPAGNAVTLTCGETTTIALSFNPPETNQTVTPVVNTNGLCNTVVATTDGVVGTATITITAGSCNTGTHVISVTATDDFVPPASTTIDITVNVIGTPNAGNIDDGGLSALGACISYTAGFSSDGDAGGIWSSSDPSVATVDPLTGHVTCVGAGTTIISYTVTNACSSATSDVSITVGPNANAGSIVGGPFILCLGSSAGYASTGDAGGTWTSSNPSVVLLTPVPGGVFASALSGGTSTITYTTNGGCNGPSTTSIVVTVEDVQATLTSDPILCFNGSTCFSFVGSGGLSPYTSLEPVCGYSAPGPYTFHISDAKGCTVTVTSGMLTEPAQVDGNILTTPASCLASDGTATVYPTGGSGAYTNFVWNPAPGGGQGTPTATGLVGGAMYTCTITDNNGCTGTAGPATVGLPAGPTPTPGPISGPAGACKRQSAVTYCVPAVSGVSSYIWSLPAHASGASTSNCITVNFDNYYAGGTIKVRAVTSACGQSAQAQLNVPLLTSKPGKPLSISGPAGLCILPADGNYSCPSVANATSYMWTYTGTGLSITAGQGTNSITLHAAASFTYGTLSVRASNCVGFSDQRTISVYGPLGAPSNSCEDEEDGDENPLVVCPGKESEYEICTVPGATYYTWSASSNLVLEGEHVTGNPVTMPAHGHESEVEVNFPSGFVSGFITVNAGNVCGLGPATTFNVTALQAPGAITGPSSPCKSVGAGYTYCVANVPGVTYEWKVSDGGAHFVGPNNAACVNINFTGINAAHNPVTISVRAKVEGCESSWTTRTITVNLSCRTMDPVTAATAVETALNAYPNPTSGKLNVTFNTSSKEKYTLKVADVIGNILLINTGTTSEGLNSQDLDLTGISGGMYFLSIERDGKESQTMRIIVE